VAVFGKNEISAIFASLKAMQGSLRETVTDVRQGSYAMHTGISEIAAGNNDLSPAPSSRRPRWRNGGQHGATDRDGSQNADNARQASDLSKQAANGEERGRPGVSCCQHHA
jgi:methyl-accepting chemotaxis protein-4 (peptide sensor receptor)